MKNVLNYFNPVTNTCRTTVGIRFSHFGDEEDQNSAAHGFSLAEMNEYSTKQLYSEEEQVSSSYIVHNAYARSVIFDIMNSVHGFSSL